MRLNILLIFLFLRISAGAINATQSFVWHSPSEDASASMPCGGGDTGLNVWVENNELLFYISRSGTYDENNTLLKQGRIRIRLSPNPFADAQNYKQELRLDNGAMTISANGTSILLWVDVFKPIIHVEITSPKPVQAQVHYENWRYRDRIIRRGEGQQNSYKWAPPQGLMMRADSIIAQPNSLIFYHQNPGITVFDHAVEQQGMEAVKNQMMNPLAHLTSGGKIISSQLQFSGTHMGEYAGTDFKAWVLTSRKAEKKIQLMIALHTEQSENIEIWKTGLNNTLKSVHQQKDQQRSYAWWKQFNERSFIRASGEAEAITRNYTLFRHMLGCNAYGSDPTKFNGGLFTFDPVLVDTAQAFTPDYRKWGGGTMTAQNQRLIYWPLLKSGDFDLMPSQFNFYRRMLRNAELRSEVYWGHPGAAFAEQIENYGLPNPTEYGWKRPEYFDKGVEYNAWLEYQWETALEFCQMILDTKLYNNADISQYLPMINSVVQFFDEHYRYRASHRGRRTLDERGHLILFPSSACETYKMTLNPTPTIAGLQRVLISLGDPDSILHRIPPIEFRSVAGKTLIAPAKSWERVNNTEAPQLYPVFPWRLYGVGKPELEIARDTYWHDPDLLKFRSHIGWKQDNIFAACLGLTDEAKRLTLLKMSDGPHRFPAFWGPGFDWTPDHNHGGSGMIGLQEMLLQTNDDGTIHLFPAWPKEWDVHFKLHAPHQTTVEAKLENGVVTQLIVTPEHRKHDCIVH